MKCVILCGGIGARMNGYSMPKPLNMIHGKPSIYYTLQSIPKTLDITFVYGAHLKKYNFEEIVINLFKDRKFTFSCVEYFTRGALESAFIGTKLITGDGPIVFLDNDNIYNFPPDFERIRRTNFIGCSIDSTDKSSYSFVLHDSDMNMYDIAEKVKISNTYCCGVYGFKNIDTFRRVASDIICNHTSGTELYMSSAFKSLILQKELVKCVMFDSNTHVGSLTELKHFHNMNLPRMRICVDLDNTLVTYPSVPGDYSTVRPIHSTIELIQRLSSEGHTIILHTARRMLTHKHNIGAVIKDIGRITFDTLEKFNIPYDELIFGKPIADVYIDDRSVNPYKNDYMFMGILEPERDSIVNQLPTNKYNQITLKGDRVIKTGPTRILKGEKWAYEHIPSNIYKYFPKLISSKTDESTTTLEFEYLKGIPLYYLYKNGLITTKHVDSIIFAIEQFHASAGTLTASYEDIKNNYIKKLEDRFKVQSDYPFEDALKIQSKILHDLGKYCDSGRIRGVPFIHGDSWFSNIILQFDGNLKFFDMRGRLGDTLTTNGDVLYDYAKVYQSLLGFDSVLYDPDIVRHSEIIVYFEEQVKLRGILLSDLKTVSVSLISGTLSFVDSEYMRKRIWNFVKDLMNSRPECSVDIPSTQESAEA